METRNCQNCKKSFQIVQADFDFYAKLNVPAPTWCPPCRFQRRALFRNERKLFRTKESRTGDSVISLIPPESGWTIYDDTIWYSDAWDPYEYGMDFDRSRPFLAQLFELMQKVPKPRSNVLNMIRSEYSANASDLKDCYLLFNSNSDEDCAYGNGIDMSRFCFDCSHVKSSERCYGSFWLTKCYDTHFSSMCDDCVSVWFSKNCRGCNDCFGCVNLVKKSYCWFNEQLTKEEYQKRIKELKLNSWKTLTDMQVKASDFWLRFPMKYLQGVHNVQATGEYISHSKNVRHSYLIREGEDLAYIQYGQIPPLRDCMDCTIAGKNTELNYECVTSGWGSVQMKFCWECWDGGLDMEYCMYSGRHASYLFGCVSVGSGEYAILNKKYSKEEFLKLKAEIIQHMNDMPYTDEQGRVYKYGEFFPPSFAPFAYNDTITAEHFPLSTDEIIVFGAKVYEVSKTEYQTSLKASDLPDSSMDAAESLFRELIACESCSKAYRIIPQELQFLQQNHIPLPHQCIDCRHKNRIMQRNKSRLYKRSCGCGGARSVNDLYLNIEQHDHADMPCSRTFETSYSPERTEIVYCEECYQKEVN